MEEYEEEIMIPERKRIKKKRQKTLTKSVEENLVRREVVYKNRRYCQVEVIDTVTREVDEPVFRERNLYDAEGKKVIGRHRVPTMETITEEVDVLAENGELVLVGSGKFVTKERRKLHPHYDESKEYVSREDRPEWNCVGLLGQLRLRKGQPVGPSWVKMQDISDEVELWLVK